MSDAFVIFRKRIPFEVRLDNGQSWEVSMQTGMKSGYAAVVAAPRFKKYGEGRFYILTSGKDREVADDLTRGFVVRTGTPERGLVSAMRRAGVVILANARLPPIPT